jgi:hypothetical protein
VNACCATDASCIATLRCGRQAEATRHRRQRMSQRYHLTLADPAKARGADAALSFQSVSADGFAQELEAALRTTALFDAWRAQQEDPDAIDPALGAIDPSAQVRGEQRHLQIDLVATTAVSGNVLRHRLRLLAGSGWALHDVTAA